MSQCMLAQVQRCIGFTIPSCLTCQNLLRDSQHLQSHLLRRQCPWHLLRSAHQSLTVKIMEVINSAILEGTDTEVKWVR